MMGLAISIFLGTFLLEDVALASALVLVSQEKLPESVAFAACFLGISVGDLGLYLLGHLFQRFESRWPRGNVKKWLEGLRRKGQAQEGTVGFLIVVSRMAPGTRLPIYCFSGFVRYPIWRFLILTAGSVLAWVSLAFLLGRSLQGPRLEHSPWFVLFAFLITFWILKNVLQTLLQKWERRAFFKRAKRWLSFEFWPALLFYQPIVPIYAFLGIKYRSLLKPFYANPIFLNSGLIGESKWDILQHLQPQNASTLKTNLLPRDASFETAEKIIADLGLKFPFILKPDIGQRGYGVRIIGHQEELRSYLETRDFDCVVQELSHFKEEAGLFYVRRPNSAKGQIISITLKDFPFVQGDGKSSLGELILKDPRAAMMSKVYFQRFVNQLDSVPARGMELALSECGNHCQGAIFKNGNHLIQEDLIKVFDAVATQIPGFYFGRFDIRYESLELLKQGKNFEIIEINGAGSEVTHIWDEKTTIWEAYRDLYRQWSLLFAIGSEVQALKADKLNVSISKFLQDCVKVWIRKEDFSVSS